MHALLADRVWQHALVERQGGYVVLAAGGDAELLDPEDALAAFDAALAAEPAAAVMDSDTYELLTALGLRPGRR